MVTAIPTLHDHLNEPSKSHYFIRDTSTWQLALPVCAGWKCFSVPELQLVQTLVPEGPSRAVHIQRHFHAQAMLLQQAADERLIA